MTEKRQTSQGYIIRILQHFATKLRNITNFVIDALSSCDEIFVQAYLDQNFTHKGKGLLGPQPTVSLQNGTCSWRNEMFYILTILQTSGQLLSYGSAIFIRQTFCYMLKGFLALYN
jgi:hypothetical protein